MIDALNHFNVLTDDLERTLKFYVDGLGLVNGPRPAFSFPGAWLYAGERPIVHVVADRELPAQRVGTIDHIAFSARDLRAVTTRLDAIEVPYELRRVPGSGVWQLFCVDPGGANVELDFESSESR